MSDDESAGEEIYLIKQVNVFRRKFNYALITSFLCRCQMDLFTV